jgi:small subunit ribosomal protein S5
MVNISRKNKREKGEFEQKLVDVARVARVVAGGKRFRFRVVVCIGNKKGKVGVGVAKGNDVSTAINKAVAQAKKNLIEVPIVKNSIAHEIKINYRGAKVFLKPATEGTGIIAGGAVRAVVELAGIKNILSKMQGSNNKLNNVKATMLALQKIKKSETIALERGKSKKK